MKPSGVTKLIEVFEDKMFVYQVTSQMNSGNLQYFMENTSTRYLSLEEIVGPARSVVCAVAAIHLAGYLHNDI